MKKWLVAVLAILFQGTVTAFAMPVSLNLFAGGLSVLDSLLLIGAGLMLLGILFLCIAFLKPNKETVADNALQEEDFLKQLIEETVTEDAEAEEDTEMEILDTIEETEITEEESEEPEDGIQEEFPSEELEEETEPEVEPEVESEDEPEIEPEIEPEDEPEENYPTLTLMGINNGEFKVLPLKGKVTLGRRPENDLIFSDTTVSGIHCEITVEEDKVYLLDKDSTNGTFINGQKITEKTEIHKGDIMVLGQMELKISI